MTKQLLPNPWKFDPTGDLRIMDVRSAQDLALHAAAWAELLLQSPAASPMLSYPQISAYIETQLLASETWLCLFAYEGESLVGVFPLTAARSFGVLGFSILCLKTPYNNLHTSGVDCLTIHGREEIVDVFVDYLSLIPRTWPLIRLRELPEHSPSMVYLNRTGSRLIAIQNLSAAESYIPISGDFGKYHSELSSNFRRQLKRGNKKLQELEEVMFHCREQTRHLTENMRRFEEVEDAGWKGAESTSIKSVAGSSRFYTIAAERFQNEGWMEWNFIETKDKTIGAHYAVRIKRTLFLLKIGYDESYSVCSPGNLLLEKAIEHATRMGDVDEINCVADAAWHKNWGMQKRVLYDLVILPKIPIISRLLKRLSQSNLFNQFYARWNKNKAPASTV